MSITEATAYRISASGSAMCRFSKTMMLSYIKSNAATYDSAPVTLLE
jgi:hypothetical protein